MSLYQGARYLLKEAGSGQAISRSAYDTAWLARLIEVDAAVGEAAITWLCEHQLPNGSWGAEPLLYYHDRLVCTLAAVTTLARYGQGIVERGQIERGRSALAKITEGATRQLIADPNGATIGFELIVPALAAEAEALGQLTFQKERLLHRLHQLRSKKLQMLGDRHIDRFSTAAYSAEMVGKQGIDRLDVEHLQEDNGSIAYSPAATAFFAQYVRPGDAAALAYLSRACRNGAVPGIFPIDVFEHAWGLWNLGLTPLSELQGFVTEVVPNRDYLASAWFRQQGVGNAKGFSLLDSDDSSVTYEALLRWGQPLHDQAALLRYESEADHFICFEHEAHPSLSANVHILSALRADGCTLEFPAIQKILRFMAAARTSEGYWLDKWHISPYYVTAHFVIACAGYVDDAACLSVEWLVASQRFDGSWGWYRPTAEETAYALQALCVWRRAGHRVDREQLRRGAGWLAEHAAPPYPAQWIGKCLYSPDLVVQGAILSALLLAEEALAD